MAGWEEWGTEKAGTESILHFGPGRGILDERGKVTEGSYGNVVILRCRRFHDRDKDGCDEQETCLISKFRVSTYGTLHYQPSNSTGRSDPSTRPRPPIKSHTIVYQTCLCFQPHFANIQNNQIKSPMRDKITRHGLRLSSPSYPFRRRKCCAPPTWPSCEHWSPPTSYRPVRETNLWFPERGSMRRRSRRRRDYPR